MPPPWYCHCCVPIRERKIVDGILWYYDERDFDIGEDRPFLTVSPRPDFLRAPPPEYSSRSFRNSYGVHHPVCFGYCLVPSLFDMNNSLWITILLLIAPSITWSVFVAPELDTEFGLWPLLVTLSLLFCTVLFLLITWLVEPGILPHVDMEDRSDPDKPKKLTFVILNGQYFLEKTFRARTSRFTNSSIEKFDHYCPYVGNAVGKRNYRYFILFLTFSVLLSFFIVGSSIALVYARRNLGSGKFDFWHAVKESAGATVIGGFCLVMGVSIFTLLFYHCKIITKGVTTSEDLKNIYFNGNPYDEGCWGNCIQLWCSPHYPSRVNSDPVSSFIFSLEQQDRQTRTSSPLPDVVALNEALLFSPSTPASTRGTTPNRIVPNTQQQRLSPIPSNV